MWRLEQFNIELYFLKRTTCGLTLINHLFSDGTPKDRSASFIIIGTCIA